MQTNRRKKRVCFVIPTHFSSKIGGSQYQIKCFIEYLTQNYPHYDIYYLTRRFDHSYIPCNYNISNIVKENKFNRFSFWLDTFFLLNKLKKIKPDTIYQRVGCSYTGICAYYSKLSGCKFIWHIASDEDVIPEKFNFKNKKLQNINRYISRMFFEYGIRNSEIIINQTDAQSNDLSLNYGQRTFLKIPNFHPFPSETINKSQDDLNIIWIGNLKPLKRPEIFINLANDINYLCKKNILFIMIGAPDNINKEWQTKIDSQIARINNLKYLGSLPIESVNKYLANSHILINTSSYEGFPNTFIQAWMRNVPVVSLNVNPDNTLSDNNIGYFANSYKNLVQLTLKLINDNDLRYKMGSCAKTFSFDHFSLKNASKLAELL